MDMPITVADVQAAKAARQGSAEMTVDKATLTRTAVVYVARPASWTATELQAAIQTRAGDLAQRACWYDAESGPEITVEMGKDDRSVEMRSGPDGAEMPHVEGPDPLMLDDDDLTPVVVTVVES